MGRQKTTPKKLQNNDISLPLSLTGDFRPVFKRSKPRKKSADPFIHYPVLSPNEESSRYFLGELLIGHTNNILSDTYKHCKVSISKSTYNNDDNDCKNIIICCDEATSVVELLLDLDFIRGLLSTKIFAFQFKTLNDEVILKVYFVSLPLPKFTIKIAKIIKCLFQNLFEIFPVDENQTNSNNKDMHSNSEISTLYNNLSNLREVPESKINIQHWQLKPQLRLYQAEAVKWMLQKETAIDEADELHPMFVKIKIKSDLDIYYDKYSGYVQESKPTVGVTCKGGILADEMGLGKTVEVLACLLLNKSPKPNKMRIDSSDSEGEDEKSPVIEKQSKKRHVPVEDSYDYLNYPKKPKVQSDWVKNGKKSANYVALQKFYNNTLNEFCTTKSEEIPEEQKMRCICGSSSENNSIECDCCGKYQHKSCLGYKKQFGRYLCPQCWLMEPLIDIGATLIVTPASLHSQWCKEICKHIRGEFRVLSYQGNSLTPVYPAQLKEYDIVLTTYTVLQNELRLTELGQEFNLRRQRKYSHTGSPLIRMNWWRLCLDEAQTVDAPTKMVSEMAHKITARHRWAITGTPISKNISDIHGLLDYLHINPYNDLQTWKHILHDPYMNGDVQPMYNFLSKTLWRTSKQHVLDQIGVPQQTFQTHLLEFSAVEKYFYRREHELCRNSFLNISEKFDAELLLEKLDRRSLKKLLAPLYTLRQACSHPNTVRGKYLATKKKVTSMKDLLDALILKNIADSEECLRLIISSLNGLAGIYLLFQSPQDAIDKYREVLQLSSRFSDENNSESIKLTVDKLQQIHAMHNLADILDSHPPLHPTLRDSTLREDCLKVEQQYIEKFMKETCNVYQSSSSCVEHIRTLQEKLELGSGQWYAQGIEWVFANDYEEDLFRRIEGAADVANVDTKATCRVNEKNLLKLIYEWDADIFQQRDDLLAAVDLLYEQSNNEDDKIIIKDALVTKAMDCHLRPQKKSKTNKAKCLVCQANDQLKHYEGKLFSMTKRKLAFEDMSLMGSWKPTVEELTFRSLLALLKAKNATQSLIKDGETYINIIEGLKKEFKEVRRLWTFLNQQICAQDELGICKIRLQLKTNLEEPEKKQNNIIKNLIITQANPLENINMLSEHELDYQRTLLHNDHNLNMGKLDSLLGTQSYLETLKKQQYEGQSPDPCPICKNTLDQHWSILHCGHSYCLECIQLLLEKIAGDYIQCSVCRKRQRVQDISYIKAGNNVVQEDTKNIRGNYSTKIEAVIKLLLDLKEKDDKVKVLLFSSWESVLRRLKSALDENKISAELAVSSNFEKHIDNFKDSSKGVMNLLLPVHLGAKGLNLIEATHVILIEPLINPADELQAIGRVHRIGQTKSTVVHKFLIKHTIEESIHHATTSNAENWDKSKLTLQSLVDLFLGETGFTENNVELEGGENDRVVNTDDATAQNIVAVVSSSTSTTNNAIEMEGTTNENSNIVELDGTDNVSTDVEDNI